jgi:hypothetical protein
MFFFEKKNQKTFRLWRTRPGERTRQRTKVFCFFASEKKTFLPLLAIPLCAAEPNCNQTLVDGTSPPATAAFILPASPVTPFYQWENNNGYCGEVSLLQAGLAHGQWLDQLNTRLVCGTGLSQSGPSGACAAHDHIANYNAQLLIETPGTGVSGSHIYADAPQCMANARLNGVTFPYETQATGLAGYQQYMSWVKAQVIAGNQVTLAVLLNGGSDPQYDHEVAVLKIGTTRSPIPATTPMTSSISTITAPTRWKATILPTAPPFPPAPAVTAPGARRIVSAIVSPLWPIPAPAPTAETPRATRSSSQKPASSTPAPAALATTPCPFSARIITPSPFPGRSTNPAKQCLCPSPSPAPRGMTAKPIRRIPSPAIIMKIP